MEAAGGSPEWRGGLRCKEDFLLVDGFSPVEKGRIITKVKVEYVHISQTTQRISEKVQCDFWFCRVYIPSAGLVVPHPSRNDHTSSY